MPRRKDDLIRRAHEQDVHDALRRYYGHVDVAEARAERECEESIRYMPVHAEAAALPHTVAEFVDNYMRETVFNREHGLDVVGVVDGVHSIVDAEWREVGRVRKKIFPSDVAY